MFPDNMTILLLLIIIDFSYDRWKLNSLTHTYFFPAPILPMQLNHNYLLNQFSRFALLGQCKYCPQLTMITFPFLYSFLFFLEFKLSLKKKSVQCYVPTLISFHILQENRTLEIGSIFFFPWRYCFWSILFSCSNLNLRTFKAWYIAADQGIPSLVIQGILFTSLSDTSFSFSGCLHFLISVSSLVFMEHILQQLFDTGYIRSKFFETLNVREFLLFTYVDLQFYCLLNSRSKIFEDLEY